MMLPGTCGIKNSVSFVPDYLSQSDVEFKIEKRGVLKKTYKNQLHYVVIFDLDLNNRSDKDFIFKLSEMKMHNSQGQQIQIYRNAPAHVLDRNITLKGKSSSVLNLYLTVDDLDQQIRFNGIAKP